jgi:DNA-directed RNA polymerase subunit H
MADDEPLTHELIPKHEKLDDDERDTVLERYHISGKEMPKIKINDPAIEHMDVEEGDVIKITRDSPTAGETVFYRSVMRE